MLARIPAGIEGGCLRIQRWCYGSARYDRSWCHPQWDWCWLYHMCGMPAYQNKSWRRSQAAILLYLGRQSGVSSILWLVGQLSSELQSLSFFCFSPLPWCVDCPSHFGCLWSWLTFFQSVSAQLSPQVLRCLLCSWLQLQQRAGRSISAVGLKKWQRLQVYGWMFCTCLCSQCPICYASRHVSFLAKISHVIFATSSGS